LEVGLLTKEKILIVEDEVLVAQQIEEELQGFGYEVVSQVSYGEDVSREVDKYHPDLVLMDINLKGDMNGIEAAHLLRSSSEIPVIFLTAYGDHLMFERASQTDPYGFLTKPFRPQELYAAIALGINQKQLGKNHAIREHFFRNIVEKSEDIIFMLNSENKITYANPAFRFLGYDLLDLKGKPIETIIESDDVPEILDFMATKDEGAFGAFGTFGLEVIFRANEESAISEYIPMQKYSLDCKGVFEEGPGDVGFGLNFSFDISEKGEISVQPPHHRVSVDSLGLFDVPRGRVINKKTEKKFLGTLCIGKKID
jgi:CheY-like chemotaxis protein